MGFISVSLAGRAGLLNTALNIVPDPDLFKQKNKSCSLFSLQRIHLITNDTAQRIVSQAADVSTTVSLKDYHFNTWSEVLSDSRLSHLMKRVIESQQKTLYWVIQQERLNRYLEVCWDKLKSHFRQFCIELQNKHLSA